MELGLRGFLDLLALPAPQGLQARPDLLAPLVQQAQRAQQAPLDLLALLDLRVRLADLGLLAPPGLLAPLGLQAHKETQALQVQLAQLALPQT